MKQKRERWECCLFWVLHSIFSTHFLTSPKLIILLCSVVVMGSRTRGLTGWHFSAPTGFLRPFREFSEHTAISCHLNRFFPVRYMTCLILILFLLQMTSYFTLLKSDIRISTKCKNNMRFSGDTGKAVR